MRANHHQIVQWLKINVGHHSIIGLHRQIQSQEPKQTTKPFLIK